MMTKLAKFIRIVTVAPIAAIVLILSMTFVVPDAFDSIFQIILAITLLAIFPLLAYPIERKFHLSKLSDDREGGRHTAIIFSMVGYSFGAIFAFVFQLPQFQQILYLTYFFSGVLILVANFVLGLRASGHMCGIAGPVSAMIYFGGWIYVWLFVLLVGVVWASLYLKRHKVNELIFGMMISITSLIVAVLLIG